MAPWFRALIRAASSSHKLQQQSSRLLLSPVVLHKNLLEPYREPSFLSRLSTQSAASSTKSAAPNAKTSKGFVHEESRKKTLEGFSEQCTDEEDTDYEEEDTDNEIPRFNYKKMLTMEEVQKVLEDVKADDVQSIYTRDQCEWTDYMVIASGRSAWHVQNIARALLYKVKKKQRLLGIDQIILPRVEGQAGGKWLLVDTGSIIVHVLDENAREYYDLESLWTKERKGKKQKNELEKSLENVLPRRRVKKDKEEPEVNVSTVEISTVEISKENTKRVVKTEHVVDKSLNKVHPKRRKKVVKRKESSKNSSSAGL